MFAPVMSMCMVGSCPNHMLLLAGDFNLVLLDQVRGSADAPKYGKAHVARTPFMPPYGRWAGLQRRTVDLLPVGITTNAEPRCAACSCSRRLA